MIYWILFIGAIGIALIIAIELLFDGLFFKLSQKQSEKTEKEFSKQLKPIWEEARKAHEEEMQIKRDTLATLHKIADQKEKI